MSELNLQQVINDCVNVAKAELGKSWKSFKPYAEHEFQQFTENAKFLADLRTKGTIDDAELASRLEIQRLALKNVLLTIQGVGLITAQNTINAILNVVYKAVNAAVGIVLPI